MHQPSDLWRSNIPIQITKYLTTLIRTIITFNAPRYSSQANIYMILNHKPLKPNSIHYQSWNHVRYDHSATIIWTDYRGSKGRKPKPFSQNWHDFATSQTASHASLKRGETFKST